MGSPEDTTERDAKLRTMNPYRDEPFLIVKHVHEIERENSGLRRLVVALVSLSLLLAGAAAWWFGTLWQLTSH